MREAARLSRSPARDVSLDPDSGEPKSVQLVALAQGVRQRDSAQVVFRLGDRAMGALLPATNADDADEDIAAPHALAAELYFAGVLCTEMLLSECEERVRRSRS